MSDTQARGEMTVPEWDCAGPEVAATCSWPECLCSDGLDHGDGPKKAISGRVAREAAQEIPAHGDNLPK